MNPIAMAVMITLLVATFSWSASRRWKLLRVGVPEPRFTLSTWDDLVARLKDVVVYAGAQKKMPYYRLAGIAHMLIFLGFNVLLIRTLILWGRGFDADFDFFGILREGSLLGNLYGLAKDTFGMLVIAGALVFVYFRIVKREQRMSLGIEGLVILGIIITMMLADMTYDGASMQLHARVSGEGMHVDPWAPAGTMAAYALSPFGDGTLHVLGQLGFWWHSSFVLIFLNLLPYSKHFHIITAAPNVFTRDRTPRGALPMVTDLEGKVEREEPIGLVKAKDLSWKYILDLYTCTECGRCSDNCPAYITGKKLSPKHLTLALRDHLYDLEPVLLGTHTPGQEESVKKPDAPREELDTHPPAPADAYFRSDVPVELVPNIVDPDVIWACTSCRACEEQCPVMISYVDKIVEMRRNEVMIKADFPPELQKPFRGIETNGNPWNLPAMDRAGWADGLPIAMITDKPDAAVLFWVGCAASYDDRAKKIARATARLLLHAEIDFAILGTEETCTGDPARRAGNEFLFQMMAQQNVETLNGYGVGKKTIVTSCPHCFNTLLNEYPAFGGKYDVVHHSDFLAGLIARRKLVPTKSVDAEVVYHDSCYLGRYNDVYDAPRKVLESIPGVRLLEVPYWNKNKGLCCGAGGAQFFMEEREGKERVSTRRTLQLIDTGAKTLASACPFCMTMITDGIKAAEREDDIKPMDIAELLVQSVAIDERTTVPQAAE